MRIATSLWVAGIVATGLAIGGPANAQDPGPQFAGALESARRIAASVIAGDSGSVLAQSEPGLVAEFGGPGKLSAFITALPGQFGKETGLDHDRLQLRVKGPIYSRIVTVEKGAPVRIDIGFDPSTGLISSLSVKPAAGKGKAVPPRAARTRLTLPFSMPRPGHLWALSNGGAQVIDNYHNRLDTFYAIDISPRAMNSLATPATPADAPCWDLPILAAAPGTVAIARDGMADEPKLGINGNPAGGPGNHVIIDHGNGEFTLYAHLRQGSVIGKPGDRVARGQQVGRCGNSASPGPHLHFQLMDGSDLDTARGLPLVFHDYYAPLRYVEQGTIVRGDVVLPAIPLGKAIPKQAGRASIGKPAARSR